MKPSGTIYNSRHGDTGELRIALTKKEKKRMKILQWLGANMASFGLAAVLFFYGPTFLLDMDYFTKYNDFRKSQLETQVAQAHQPADATHQALQAGESDISNNYTSAADQVQIEPSPQPTPIVKEFSIAIPEIDAESVVIENIDPFDKDEYLAALQTGIAHAEGTGKPGEGKRIYLFAHSTNSPLNFSRYNAVFYQLRLLEEGHIITVQYNGTEYEYEVTQKKVVEANDVSWLKAQTSSEDLVLQTCDPPGTSLRRLLVIAKPA